MQTMRALVVDDSRAMRGILRRILTEIGFEAISDAADGQDGLAMLRETAPPDVVLVDWSMPQMNGIEFVEAVRRDPQFATLKLMMVTTELEQPLVQAALQAGADDYIMKPFTRHAIVERLGRLGLRLGGARG